MSSTKLTSWVSKPNTCGRRFTKYFRRMSKQMLDERIRRYEDADINKISYKIRTGKIVDAIVHQSEETDCDLIVMASSKIIL
jgi:nucleotide-binding universal stress UspA family protein